MYMYMYIHVVSKSSLKTYMCVLHLEEDENAKTWSHVYLGFLSQNGQFFFSLTRSEINHSSIILGAENQLQVQCTIVMLVQSICIYVCMYVCTCMYVP